MTEAERLAQWYFRLNGCLTIPNFVLHPIKAGSARTDADIVAFRFQRRRELFADDIDDTPFREQVQPCLWLAEVKSRYVTINNSWVDKSGNNIRSIVEAIGLALPDESENVAAALRDHGTWSNGQFASSLFFVGDLLPDELVQQYCAVPHRTWTQVTAFVYGRFTRFDKVKTQHDQWDSTGQKLWTLCLEATDVADFERKARREFHLRTDAASLALHQTAAVLENGPAAAGDALDNFHRQQPIKMKEATELFSKVFINLPTRWSDIYGFRQVAELGLPHAAKILALNHLQSARRFISDPANAEIFLDKAKFIESSGGPDVMGAAITEKQLAAFNTSVDSASLVFMHSALDGAAFDLCRVAALVAPTDWEPFVLTQKVALSDVKAVGYNAIIRKRLASFLDAVERESLPAKTDRLFQLCRPPRGFSPVDGYQFDRERLVELDQARHGLVHGHRGTVPPRDMGAAIEFLLNTGMFLVGLVNHRYQVRVDPAYALAD